MQDSVKLAYGFVPKSGGSNYTVSGPASLPALTPFDLSVDWNLGASYNTSQVWYGWFSVGSSASLKNDIGKIDVNLYKEISTVPISVYLPLLVR